MKKLFYVILSIMIIGALVLASCGEPEETTKPTTPAATTPAATTPAATTPAATTPAATTPAETTSVSPTPTAKYGGTFKFIDARSPTSTLGWYAESGALISLAVPPMIERLIDIDEFANISGALATDWEIAQDLKSITFTLRNGVKFHDGSDFNAEVAKWNIDQYIDAEVTSVAKFESVDIINDYTIRLNLNSWENTVLNDINNVVMVSKQAFDNNGIEWLRWNPVGTGPFKFVSFERDVSVKCEKFNDYWQEGKPYLDAIEIYFVTDPMTMAASLKAGEVDAVGRDLARSEYDLLQSSDEFYLVKQYTGVIHLVPDSKNPDSPFANEKVRLAVDYAIDREAIVDAMGLGFQVAVHQYSVPGNPAYISDLPPRDYDPEKAKQLLAEAGYTDGFKTLLLAHNIVTDKEEMGAIQGYLAEVGIDADMDWVDHATFNQSRMGGWENALLASAFTTGANAAIGATSYLSQTGVFYTSLDKTDEMQQLLMDARAAPTYDPELMKKFIRYLYDHAVAIPLWGISRGHVMYNYVHDTGMYTMNGWSAWKPADAWLSK